MTLKDLVEKQNKEFTEIWDKKNTEVTYNKFLSQVRLEIAKYILGDLEIESGWTFNRISKIIAELEELKP